MPRLRDVRTGVVVDVDDATAAGLGAAYKPVVVVSKKAPAKSAPSKSEK